ncbi:MAG: histidine ammonia-lyase [Candidatus Bipolaricaulota bacterium]|nr:histidine ammonia-lyase [Candidatus Bipolaricaulota bacterium]MCS7274589.1 histidine ammonia-lyase [Candidatus Bipolaricaulota bacterium]MDW8110980.1 histidine ammonia-lyase [Candidatus Bipolaricaulota bacterium]MDW8329019.1 histidine ammonia-lyase [Candidatus Bipolaricaulota bacterium]
MIELDGHSLTLEAAAKIVFGCEKVSLASSALERVRAARALVEQIVSKNQRVYGINTGFGKLSTEAIPSEKLSLLQENLLKSHAVGVGEPLPDEVARAALLFRLNSLLQGRSGVRVEVIEYLKEFVNRSVVPIIPSKGSVGSSGDLAPLAHLALLLIGEGHAKLSETILSGREVLRELGLEPLRLAPKEGLALVNGTQITLALGFVALVRAQKLLAQAQAIGALAVEALRGHTDAFDERLHRARPHSGQLRVAQALRDWLHGSQLVNGRTDDVQDNYTLRCIPQVLGASLDALDFVAQTFQIEMNSATDNPLVFAESGEVLSGGNFHGQILAFCCELLGQAVAEIGNFSERQIALLLEAPDLPKFLVQESGLNSGLMVPQYTAAALVAENKVLAHPASVDSIPTSGGKEDHNSMATTSAYKALRIVENVEIILAIALLTVRQALRFRDPSLLAPRTRALYERLSRQIPPLDKDRLLQYDIQRAIRILKEDQGLNVI